MPGVSQLQTFVDLLGTHVTDNLAELLFEAIGSRFTLLNLKHFNKEPLEVVVVSAEEVLDF